MLRPGDGTPGFAADATFRPLTGLTGEYTSLQLWRDPSRYIRHSGFLVNAAPVDGSQPARLSATFAARVGFVDPPVPLPGAVTGAVTNGDGSPVGGVAVDLFTANADGSRGTWLQSITTGPDGSYRFDELPVPDRSHRRLPHRHPRRPHRTHLHQRRRLAQPRRLPHTRPNRHHPRSPTRLTSPTQLTSPTHLSSGPV